MKKIILVLLILHSITGNAQSEFRIFYDDYVECYFDNTSGDSLMIYDSINGNLLTSLKIAKEDERFLWYKIAIKKTHAGWAQIENIMIAPGASYTTNKSLGSFTNSWIQIKNLKINTSDLNVADSEGVPFYKEPNLKSEIVCKSGTFLKLTLLETKGLWAKVSFTYKGMEQIAWIERKNQCAYPWTTCPFNP